jgi:pimeloyl-ACP methyl ester carboxylesterase
MPFKDVLQIKSYYTQQGEGKDVLCLVGWGQDSQMFQLTADCLADRFRVTVVDYPGFGQSESMHEAWDVDGYVQWLDALLKVLDVKDPIIIAHSFGARLAIKYQLTRPVRKLILTGAAGIRPKRSLDTVLRIYSFKVLKQIFKLPFLVKYQEPLRKLFGSEDYKAISGVLRASFVKIVNEDLTPYLKHIEVPTLLIWGDQDDATPLWMGKKMEKEIKDAGLVVFENDGHYAYWNQLSRFHAIVSVFLEEDASHV